MTNPWILDAVAVAVLAVCILVGVYRGLLRTVAGLVCVVVAVAGAGFLADRLTPVVAEALQPVLEAQLEERFHETLKDAGNALGELTGDLAKQAGSSLQEKIQAAGLDPGDLDLETLDRLNLDPETILDLLGLDSTGAQEVLSGAREKMTQAGTSALQAVMESVVEQIVHTLVFFLAFVLLTILLHLLLIPLNLATKLPGLHALNGLGGGVLGAAEGILVLLVVIRVLRSTGVVFDESAVSRTLIFQIFAGYGAVSA